MTDIEETLTAVLTAEADRHEVPVFSAQRIAENAVRKGFWRQRKVLLLAAIGLVGSAGAGGAVVAAGHGDDARVTVTFTQMTDGFKRPPEPIAPDSDAVRNWVLNRARAEGLTGVDVAVRQNPFALVVTGRAADTDRLRLLGETSDLMVMQARSNAGSHEPPPKQCREKSDFGPDWVLCDENGHPYDFELAADNQVKPASVHAVRRGPGARDWAVVVRLDAAGAARYSGFAKAEAATHDRIMWGAGPVSLGDPVVVGPPGDGVLESGTGFTEQQAKDAAVLMTNPDPKGGLEILKATVTPAP